MHAKQLIVICGLAMTFVGAPALAQSGTGTDRSQPGNQDRLEAAGSAARQSGQASAAGNILTSLEGIWNVQVQVNRAHWDAMGGQQPTGAGQQGTTPRPGQGGGDDDRPTINRPGQQNQNDGQNQEPEENERDGMTDPDRTTGQNIGQTGTVDGIARSQTILGCNILRTTLIIGDGTGSTGTTTPSTDRQNPDRLERGPQQRENERAPGRQQPGGMESERLSTTGSMDNNSMRSESFLGYDQNSGQYNLALMTGQGGSIHSFTGRYDQSSRRIVFTSANQPASTSISDRGAGSRSTTPVGAGQGTTGQGMSVVLQMDGTDSYTITAYQGSTSVGSMNENPTGTGTGTDLGGQPAQGQRPGQRQGEGQGQGQERDAAQPQDRSQAQAALAPNVIYKATYTKADNAQRSQLDRMFDENERGERTTTPAGR